MWHWPWKRYSVLFVKYDRYLPEIYGGVETSTHGLCKALTGRHHRASVVAVSPSASPHGNIDRQLGYPVYAARDLRTSLRYALDDFSPNVVVLQEFGPHPWSLIRDYIRKRPVLLYQHSTFPGSHLYDNEEIRARPHTRFISNSPFTSQFADTFGVQSAIVPPIFGMQQFVGRQRVGEKILMISIQRSKGADVALKVAQQRPDYQFLFVETWAEYPEETRLLKAEIAKLENATLLASVADMVPIYAASKLLLMPSRCHETWGRVATEAQLFGIPVIGSDRGRLPETIGPGGTILDPDETEPWLRAVDQLMSDRDYYDTVSEKARVHSNQLLGTIANKAEHDFLSALNTVTTFKHLLKAQIKKVKFRKKRRNRH